MLNSWVHFIRLGHSDSLSEAAQKYAQFSQEWIPNTRSTITVYSLARAKPKMKMPMHFAAKTLLHFLLPGQPPILWATTTQVRFLVRAK